MLVLVQHEISLVVAVSLMCACFPCIDAVLLPGRDAVALLFNCKQCQPAIQKHAVQLSKYLRQESRYSQTWCCLQASTLSSGLV